MQQTSDRHRWPGFGLTLDPGSGQVVEWEPFSALMSKRGEQVHRNRDRLEAEWNAAHPGETIGPVGTSRLRAEAWAHQRPAKKPTTLLLDDVAHNIARTFASKLVELQDSQVVASADVQHRFLSEAATIPVRGSTAEDVKKCIYPKLPIPSQGGGLERRFIRWADEDSGVEALAKVQEYRHDPLRRPYSKADGMPAQSSPDFLVRTPDTVFFVETGQTALSDENVQRKQKVALAWCEQIKELHEKARDSRRWDYVLLGESVIIEREKKDASVTDLLEYARLRRASTDEQERQL